MRHFFAALSRDPISLIGAAITTAAAILMATLFVFEIVGHEGSPYIGILAYLILPGIFLLGLLLIPVGVRRQRRRERKLAESGEHAPEFPVIDLNRDRTRRMVLIFLAATGVNVVILATATYKGVEVMDSTEFCGQTCHTVMEPEATAHLRSPHSRVRCVECHIGPGANWFVKSKLSGAWQVVAVAFDLHPRPIPTPVHNLRPARDTCEQCHWPNKFIGDKLRVRTHYANDEANTELKSVLLLRVGGVEGRASHGIHWHVDPDHEIRYLADESRETIYDVELRDVRTGEVKLFKGEPAEGPTEWRVMDCVDCHNRPTHIYQMPEPAVDEAIQQGKIARDLPFVRREAVDALRREYESHDAARQGIREALTGFYRDNHPEIAAERGEEIAGAAELVGQIYARNVFPAMHVTWGTYPDHIGHMDFPGCFRCHDDTHATEDGQVISQDCFTCHSLLAMEEEEPEILDLLQP